MKTLAEIAAKYRNKRVLSADDIETARTLENEAEQMARIRAIVAGKGLPDNDPASALEILLL